MRGLVILRTSFNKIDRGEMLSGKGQEGARRHQILRRTSHPCRSRVSVVLPRRWLTDLFKHCFLIVQGALGIRAIANFWARPATHSKGRSWLTSRPCVLAKRWPTSLFSDDAPPKHEASQLASASTEARGLESLRRTLRGKRDKRKI